MIMSINKLFLKHPVTVKLTKPREHLKNLKNVDGVLASLNKVQDTQANLITTN